MEITTECGCRGPCKMIYTTSLPQARSPIPKSFLQLINFQWSYVIYSSAPLSTASESFIFLMLKIFLSLKSFPHWWLFLTNFLIHILVPNSVFFFLGLNNPGILSMVFLLWYWQSVLRSFSSLRKCHKTGRQT